MGATHYTQEEKTWLRKFAEEHRQFRTDMIIGKLHDEFHRNTGFKRRTERGLLAQYEKSCRDIKIDEARELKRMKAEKGQTEQQQPTKELQKELPLADYDDNLLYQDVLAMVNGSITAMRRAEVIAHAIKDPAIKTMAGELVDGFWK